MTPEQVRHARDLLARPDNTVSSIARLLGVSRSAIYKHVPALGGRAGGAAPALDVVLAALPEDARPLPDVTRTTTFCPRAVRNVAAGDMFLIDARRARHRRRRPIAVALSPASSGSRNW